MTDDITGNFVDSIIANAAARLVRNGMEDGGGAYVVAPDDWRAHSLEEFQDRPNRVTATQTFKDVASLVAYLKRYGVPRSLLVKSSQKAAAITATLDYHDPAFKCIEIEEAVTLGEGLAAAPNALGAPSWCSHTATFKAAFHPKYEEWRNTNRKYLSQIDTGEFLEDRAEDIVEPAGADVMDMVMKFEALKKVNFASSSRLRDGNIQLLYQEENDSARGALTIPEKITLLLPVYEGMEPERITVRLRFRIIEARLKFMFVIANIEDLERKAFQRCEDAFRMGMPDVDLLKV